MKQQTRKTILWILTAGIVFTGVLFTSVQQAICQETETMEQSTEQHGNRLRFEKSPYLLQHADNPVDWYPWGEEAFEKARKEDKPIFLSIGYSTCHWCHVMEHESFEDPEVARLMNEVFVSIKVDREERPDIDKMYMTVSQMLTGSGGWPLNIIMTPDKKPFFAGTYFPKESRFGRVGMLDLIPRIQEIWLNERQKAIDTADQVVAALQKVSQQTIVQSKYSDETGGRLDEAILDAAYKELVDRFDETHGGFGTAPKFPTPHTLLFLLRYWKRSNDEKALKMVQHTLQAMRLGGIYDHIGFGFHRYSTDSKWLLPHFEKMLYDQALLAMAYTEAYQATKNEEYARTAQEIFTYVLRDMTAPPGGFYSAEDADSEGVEGKFYVWAQEETHQVLDEEDAAFVVKVFNFRKDGNFKEQAIGLKTGENIVYLQKPLTDVAADLGVTEQDLRQRIENIRQKLFDIREQRVHPHKDDKILTDWNGLMIAALAKGAKVFGEPQYAEAGERAVKFILDKMQSEKGRLLHRYRDGEAAITAHVDDYTFLIWGLIELYEATFQVGYLKHALTLNDDLIEYFWDDTPGGFYFTADDSEQLLIRQKEIYDGAVPSGNSVAMLNLLRLGRITANPELEEKAASLARTFSETVAQTPSAYTLLMLAVEFGLGPSYEVVIVGDSHSEDTKQMLQALRDNFLPNKVVLLRPTEQESPEILRLAAYVEPYVSIEDKATAYVCHNYICSLPTTDIETMLDLFNEGADHILKVPNT